MTYPKNGEELNEKLKNINNISDIENVLSNMVLSRLYVHKDFNLDDSNSIHETEYFNDAKYFIIHKFKRANIINEYYKNNLTFIIYNKLNYILIKDRIIKIYKECDIDEISNIFTNDDSHLTFRLMQLI